MTNVRSVMLASVLMIGVVSPVMADPPSASSPYTRYDDSRGAWVDRNGNPLPTIHKSKVPPVVLSENKAVLDPGGAAAQQYTLEVKQYAVSAEMLNTLIGLRTDVAALRLACTPHGASK